MNIPAPVFSRLFTVATPQLQPGRAYISNEHRPFIVYGLSAVTNNPPVGLTNTPSGVAIKPPPAEGFITLVEWGTMVPRLSRVPLAAFDRANVKPFPGNFWVSYPYFAVAPFVVDLAASFVDVPTQYGKFNSVVLDAALVPADAVNIAAAGLKYPGK